MHDDIGPILDRAREAGGLLGAELGDDARRRVSPGVQGIVLIELSKVAARDGRYPEALGLLADGTWSLLGADVHIQIDAEYAEALIDDVFEHPPREVDWATVARQCSALAGLHEFDLYTAEPDFRDFATAAAGRAEALMTVEQRSDWLERREDELARDRLKAYFFRDIWDDLPEKVRLSLVEADRSRLSTRAGRFDSVLMHVQNAMQDLCFFTIWKPLSEAAAAETSGGESTDLDWFRAIAAKLQRSPGLKPSSPTLTHYRQITGNAAFKKLVLAIPSISQADKDLLLQKTLGKDIGSLAFLRGGASHEANTKADPDSVAEIYDKFLGIGRLGYLPCLARVYLATRQPRGDTGSAKPVDPETVGGALESLGISPEEIADIVERLSQRRNERPD